MTLFSRFSDYIDAALDTLVAKGALSDGLDRSAISVEPPRDPPTNDANFPVEQRLPDFRGAGN